MEGVSSEFPSHRFRAILRLTTMSDAARQAILEPLINEEDLHEGISALVDRIAADFEGDELHVIGLLRGSFMFTADLVRLLYRHSIPLVVDFMTVSSYGGGTESSGSGSGAVRRNPLGSASTLIVPSSPMTRPSSVSSGSTMGTEQSLKFTTGLSSTMPDTLTLRKASSLSR